MSKYTPGPWHVDGGWGVYALGRHVAFCGQMTEYSGLQLNVDGADCANAHLIAASPTMFAYIEKRAAEGDQEASQILESINAESK